MSATVDTIIEKFLHFRGGQGASEQELDHLRKVLESYDGVFHNGGMLDFDPGGKLVFVRRDQIDGVRAQRLYDQPRQWPEAANAPGVDRAALLGLLPQRVYHPDYKALPEPERPLWEKCPSMRSGNCSWPTCETAGCEAGVVDKWRLRGGVRNAPPDVAADAW